MSYKIRIVIGNSSLLTRQALAVALNTVNDFQVIGDYNSLLNIFLKNNATIIDIALLDESILKFDGLRRLEVIKKANPQLKVIVFASDRDKLPVKQLFDFGVRAFLSDKTNFLALQTAVKEVYYHDYYINSIFNTIHINEVPLSDAILTQPADLTMLEKQIIVGLCKDQPVEEIASAIGVSKRTLERKKKILFEKTGTKTIASLILFAVKNSYL
jgi:DNA-binding NarL/FixJ family response regulator